MASPDLNTTGLDLEPADEVSPTATLSAHDRRVVRGCLIALGVLSVGTWIGVGTSPYLVNNYPLLLVGISPISRHMILVAPIVSIPMLFLVGGLRSLTFTTFSYFLGRSLGEPGLVWLEQRAERAGRFIRWLERFFLRWSYWAVFIFPLGAMACIAGVARMRPVGFFVTATIGIAFRMSLYILLADSIRGPIMNLLEWIRTYQVPATLVLVGTIATYQLYKHKWRGGEKAL